jgi:hypothetical protein
VAAAGDDVQFCAGQVGQQVVAEHLDWLDVVVFAGDDEDGDLDVPGLAGDVLGDPVQRPLDAGLGSAGAGVGLEN